MKNHNSLSWLGGSLLAACLVCALVAPDVPHFGADSIYYIKMARGQMSEVPKPFANRPLEPLLAGHLAAAAGISVEAVFLVFGVAALLGLCVGIGFLNRKTDSKSAAFLWPVVLLVNPVLVSFARDYVLPDIVHATMVVWFVVFLQVFEKRDDILVWCVIGACFAAMQMQRDSTLALTAVFVMIAVLRRQWGRAAGSLAGTVLGIWLVGLLATGNTGNIHGLGNFTYLALKVPYNFLKHISGFELWTDTIARMQPTMAAPVWSWHMPSWLPIGSIKTIGLSRWRLQLPLKNYVLLAASFGILPVLVLILRPRGRRQWYGWIQDQPFWLVLAAVYGGVALLIAPALGSAFYRLVGYGWPIAWIAAPRLFEENFRTTRHQVIFIVLLHLAVSWVPGLHQNVEEPGADLSALRLALIVVLQFIAWHALRGTSRMNPVDATRLSAAAAECA